MKGLKLACILMLIIVVGTSFKQDNPYAKDFMEFWTDVKDNYAYFDEKSTDWEKVKVVYLPQAQKAHSREELITVFENALEELYDNHFSLNTNLQTSTRLVPTSLDVWAEWVDGKAIILEVRNGSPAEKAGLKSGMEISSINSIPIARAINDRIGKCIITIDNQVKSYALKQLLAGTYTTERILVVKDQETNRTINLDELNSADKPENNDLLDFKLVDNNIGYVKINNSLGENELIHLFDSALVALKDTRALIIDLRETPSGGNSVVARGILSRFITEDMPYQKHVLPNEEKEFKVKRSWLEIVSPRGPFTYNKKVIILVNHWTGSMGEGLAIGFDATKKGIIVGTSMAGLVGSISGFETTELNIPYSFPAEQLYHVNGTPRELFVPSQRVDLTDPKYDGVIDPILKEGIIIAKAGGT